MMKKSLILLISLCAGLRAEFVLLAFDGETGEVGTAGAACRDSIANMTELLPGVGGIISQAAHLKTNLDYATRLMKGGGSPQEILDSLIAHDALNDPVRRQYGILDLKEGGRLAGYSGDTLAGEYRNHLIGSNYIALGIYLYDRRVIDSLVNGFNNASGTLDARLHAGLMNAKIPGADERCLLMGTSSISAFIRVAKPDDDPDSLYMDLVKHTSLAYADPLDDINQMYMAFHGIEPVTPRRSGIPGELQVRGLGKRATEFYWEATGSGGFTVEVFNLQGERIRTWQLEAQSSSLRWDHTDESGLAVSSGLYWVRRTSGVPVGAQTATVLLVP